MMIDKLKDLSFTEFYLIEFFKNTLEKGTGSIPEENYSTLEELSNHLLAEENIVDGLEKLARYQGTSEFAIFLFDMVDRIQDLSPYTVYSSVVDLAEDFVNLYQLMVEDSESISALGSALELFREKGQVSGKDEKAKAETGAGEKLLSFQEFYKTEFELQYNKALEAANLKDKKQPYTELISIFNEFNKSIHENDLDNYDPTVSALAKAIKVLDIGSLTAEELMKTLNTNMEICIQALRDLESKEQDLFLQITSTKEIPKKKAKKSEPVKETEKEMVKTEPKPEEITTPDETGEQTIDDVLHEYFKSEIEVHLDQVKSHLDQNKSDPGKTVYNNIVEEFQALKEISMIHGYNGIEHFCVSLISVLKEAKKEKLYLSDDSYSAFEQIFTEMTKIENYQTGSALSEDEQRERIDDLCNNLNDSFTKTKPKAEEEDQAEEPSPKAEEEFITEASSEELIAFSDKAKIYPILVEIYQKVHASFKGRLQLDSVLETINQLIGATKIALPEFDKEVGEPLREAYRYRDELKNEDKKACGNIIDNMWNEIFAQIKQSPDFTTIHQLLLEIKQIGEEDAYSFEDDDKIAKALVDSTSSQWNRINGNLANALIDKDEKSIELFNNFFSNFIDNCQITKYKNYLPILTYYSDLFDSENKAQITSEIVDELDNSFELVLERIESRGKTGACDDILAVLEDVITVPLTTEESAASDIVEEEKTSEEQKAEKEAPKEQIEEEAEEDVEKIFISECQQYLEDAKKALTNLQKNPDDRTLLNEIETAMHAIRSSAHLLNKSSISDMAVTIEEAAEIFGKSSITIPEGLNDTLSKAVDDLEELITNEDKNVKTSIDAIRNILDNIVIEDVAAEETEPTEEEKKEEPETLEKPLFADDESDEDMLEIFQEEAKEFITLIKEILKEKPTNAKALDQLDYAAHSLKQAAKMLGFREIGQIADSLETLTDAIKKKKVTDSAEIQDNVHEAVKLIEKLSKGEPVNTSEIAKTINLLEITKSIEPETLEKPLFDDDESDEYMLEIFQ
ncbi:MAG: Hpt domain-containing protein [Calditrichaceae bacterium]